MTRSLNLAARKELEWVTVDVLKLPKDHQFAVAEALYQRRWQSARDPFAYVSTIARTLYRKYFDLKRLGQQFESVSVNIDVLDARAEVVSIEMEIMHDLHRAMRRLGLPKDVFEIARARYEGVPDSRMAADFGWTVTRLRSARRSFNRARLELQRALSAYRPTSSIAHQVSESFSKFNLAEHELS